MRQARILISGCSGGGKSTLIQELARRGYQVVEEPGRRIVEAELLSGGSALPWTDMGAFARRAVELALEDLERTRDCPLVFFDRGLVDAAVALEHATGEPVLHELCGGAPYAATIFLAPPWPALFVEDSQRRHGLFDAIAEYERLIAAFDQLGYDPVSLPKTTVSRRADFLLKTIADSPELSA